MDGFEFLEIARRSRPSACALPILVFTADLSREARLRALALGATDFLTKPGDVVEIKLRVRNFLRFRCLHVELERSHELLESTVRERTRSLAAAREEAIALLARAGEYRDDDTGCHSERVGELSAAIAAELGLDPDFVHDIRLVAPLHDIGKISIPDKILFKSGPLTSIEQSIMEEHVLVGAALLSKKQSPLLRLARKVVQYHHERWDGQGYASGLSGTQIPLVARIVAVADAFDAMTNDRPYRRARSEAEALAEISAMSGRQFDPNIVQALLRICGTREALAA